MRDARREVLEYADRLESEAGALEKNNCGVAASTTRLHIRDLRALAERCAPHEGEREAALAEVRSMLDRIVFSEVTGLEGLRLRGPERDDWIVRTTARKTIGMLREQIDSIASTPPSPPPGTGMSEEEIAELERLEREATPAPWNGSGLSIYAKAPDRYHGTPRIADIPRGMCEWREEQNMELIIAMRNALPALLAAVRAGRK